MNIDLTDAYTEACQAIGEGVVIQRLMTKELTVQGERIAELEAQTDATPSAD